MDDDLIKGVLIFAVCYLAIHIAVYLINHLVIARY